VLYLAPRLSMLLNIHSHEEFEAMTEGKCEGISVLNGVEEIMLAYQTLQHKLLMG
jgi:hypothetical protein